MGLGEFLRRKKRAPIVNIKKESIDIKECKLFNEVPFTPLLSNEQLAAEPSFLLPLLLATSRNSVNTLADRESQYSTSSLEGHSQAVKRDFEKTELQEIFSCQLNHSESTFDSNHTESLNTLPNMPVEIFIIIAMSAGFRGAIALRSTCQKFRKILTNKISWSQYGHYSPDVIHTKATIETKLHQFDQIIFAQWPLGGRKSVSSGESAQTMKTSYSSASLLPIDPINVPCIIHRTFLEHYDFLGGLSLQMTKTGRIHCDFFEHRERLPCYIADVQKRMASGLIPPVISSRESPVGGVRVEHSCPECEHYNNQEILRSEIVHQSLNELESLSHTYVIDPYHIMTTNVINIGSIFGYNNDVPCVSTKIWKIDGKELSKKWHSFYLEYVL